MSEPACAPAGRAAPGTTARATARTASGTAARATAGTAARTASGPAAPDHRPDRLRDHRQDLLRDHRPVEESDRSVRAPAPWGPTDHRPRACRGGGSSGSARPWRSRR